MAFIKETNMNTIYFVRHAESDTTVREDKMRPLTEKGMTDRTLVTAFLQDKNIDAVLSSPYKRTIDTLADFAEKHDFQIECIQDFRERKIGAWLDDFASYSKAQWVDFNYALEGGESLSQVQRRNITALNAVLRKHKNKNLAIGTHGTALSTIINYYDHTYGYENFAAMVGIMPWIVKMCFDGHKCIEIEKIDLFDV